MNPQIVRYVMYYLAIIDRPDPKKEIVVPGMIIATLKLNRRDQIHLKAYLGISKGCGLHYLVRLSALSLLWQDIDNYKIYT